MDRKGLFYLLALYFFIGMFTGCFILYVFDSITLPKQFEKAYLDGYEKGHTDGFECAKQQAIVILNDFYQEAIKYANRTRN
jgi:hypothetical protein